MPDISVPLDIEVVKIVCVLNLAKVWALQSLDDLSFHHTGNVSWQQRQQETLLMAETQREKKRQYWDGQKNQEKMCILLNLKTNNICNILQCFI